MKGPACYLGLALLFTHELDSITNHEWRVLPLLRSLPESVGETVFIIAHIPLFALTIAYVASLNKRTRKLARDIACGFFIGHAALHALFAGDQAYEFSSLLSSVLIYGAAAFGIVYFSSSLIQVEGDRL